MLSGVVRAIWGDLSGDEVKKFSILSMVLLIIIGSYWLLRTVKDAFFDDLVGLAYQPKAKMLSLVIIIPLIIGYSKLVDLVDRHKLFYVVCSIYALAFFAIGYLYMTPIALPNPLSAYIPGSLLGWFSYVTIESFGSIAVALFWSFVASTTTTASAKRGYGMIFAAAQVGAISGPTISTYAPILGFPMLFSISALGILLVPAMIALFMKVTPPSQLISDHGKEDKKPKTGLFEGLRLLTSTPYLMGVFVVSTVYEVVGTIMDLQMKMLARQVYAKEQLAQFMGYFGQASNTVALVFALVGTGFFLRRFGVRFCLVMYPIAVGLVVAYTKLFPSLWPLFIAMVTIKALSYVLNNPVKEMMYIPTSKDVKFKAKGWIDMFGGRSAKAGGSVINDVFAANLPALMMFGSTISLGIVGVWALIAFGTGSIYNNLIKENKIIQ